MSTGTATKPTGVRSAAEPENWRKPDGDIMSCEDSIKVLRENLREIEDMCQEALEDAVLMEVAEEQFRDVLHKLVDALHNPYNKG